MITFLIFITYYQSAEKSAFLMSERLYSKFFNDMFDKFLEYMCSKC